MDLKNQYYSRKFTRKFMELEQYYNKIIYIYI